MRNFVCSLFFLGLSLSVWSQNSDYSNGNDFEMDRAYDLLLKRKYVLAQDAFSKLSVYWQDKDLQKASETSYYEAFCALKLYNKDTEVLFEQFLQNYPESEKVNQAYYHLGLYNFQKRKWEKAEMWFAKVDLYKLNTEEVLEYKFKRAYAYFVEDQMDKASPIFYELKSSESDYAINSLYYYSHIAYVNAKFQTALEGFEVLKQENKWRDIVPYYIVHILFSQNEYNKLIEYGVPLLEEGINVGRRPEIARLIGEALYHLNRYEESLVYLEEYYKTKKLSDAKDIYQLAYAHYKGGGYENAASLFEKLIVEDNELGQTSYYHLADCYMKMNKSNHALNAFYACSMMNYDEAIKEDALFNYAKLAYETAFDPYLQAVDALREYIQTYPNTEKSKQAYQLLLNVFLSTNHYTQSAEVMLEMGLNNDQIKYAYQKANYNIGIESFINNQYDKAIKALETSVQYPLDGDLAASALYWSAESYYQLKQYEKSIVQFQAYRYRPEAILQEGYTKSVYHIAYCYYQVENYKESIDWFRIYLDQKNNNSDQLKNDALLRVGDGYYVQRKFSKALVYYQSANKMALREADYGLYQEAMTHGILKQSEEKQKDLTDLMEKYPYSDYHKDAQYELATIYMRQDQEEKAVEIFKKIIEGKSEKYNKKAMINLAQVYTNQGKTQEAMAVYKTYVNQYPNYQDSKMALNHLKRIYTMENDVRAYRDYVTSLDFIDISEGDLDSSLYEAPYFQYIDNKPQRAMLGFKTYMEECEKGSIAGIFKESVMFYLAESFLQQSMPDSALPLYESVLLMKGDLFYEKALLRAARITYDRKDFKPSLVYYRQLEEMARFKSNKQEATEKLMKMYYYLRNYDLAIDYSNKIMISDLSTPDALLQAHMIAGKSALELDLRDMAYGQFEKVRELSDNLLAVEAAYNLALINYLQGNYKDAERIIFELINGQSTSDHWLAKGLILLSDVYLAIGDRFQAKHTLKSVIDNHSGVGLRELAKDKLSEIESWDLPKNDLPLNDTIISEDDLELIINENEDL